MTNKKAEMEKKDTKIKNNQVEKPVTGDSKVKAIKQVKPKKKGNLFSQSLKIFGL